MPYHLKYFFFFLLMYLYVILCIVFDLLKKRNVFLNLYLLIFIIIQYEPLYVDCMRIKSNQRFTNIANTV